MTNRNFHPEPINIVNSTAPIRICDNGGWTDTWFAEYGSVFNIAVSPYVDVQLAVYDRTVQDTHIIIHAENYEDRYEFSLDAGWDKHPLIEATIATMGVPSDISIEVTVFSHAPAGASTGTSAAVTVALIGALAHLNKRCISPHDIARMAHYVETDILGQQCGVQDQFCSAYGGINYVEIYSYPQAHVTQIRVPEVIRWELERRLSLIYLGKSHSSSKVHELVIQSLENAGADCKQLNELRAIARKSQDAVIGADFPTLGAAMIENTEAQRRLHPALVSADAAKVIKIASEHGALGWKVNGAGGDGGSLTILSNERSEAKRRMIQEIEEECEQYRNIPIRLSQCGVRVWSV